MTLGTILKVALPVPLYQNFEYLKPKSPETMVGKIGTRVRVQFGQRKLIGLIVDITKTSSISKNKLKHISEVLDEEPVFDPALLGLLFWAADYYQQPLGEVLFTALPSILRKGKFIKPPTNYIYQLTIDPTLDLDQHFRRAPKQLQLIKLLESNPHGLTQADVEHATTSWRSAMNALINKRLVKKIEENIIEKPFQTESKKDDLRLNQEQQHAYEKIKNHLDKFNCTLLDGVTGSGKTEVYLSLAEDILASQKQVLILVPEIGLTPQLVERIEKRLAIKVYLMHSGLNDTQRSQTWLASKTGIATIIVGTRSAIFLPFKQLGLIIIDEEHDLSFKQQQGFLYNARDIATYRAKQLNIPIVLGSATPSFETQHNVSRQRFNKVILSKRATDALMPDVKLIDMRSKASSEGLSNELLQAMQHELDQDNQILLFLNRRGYAPAILCQTCSWVAECSRCDSRMTFYKNRNLLVCHHCLKEQKAPEQCPKCSSENLLWLGEGTQRIEFKLTNIFPGVPITRIDRDSTRKKDTLKKKLNEVRQGKYKIIIGTQMLSKGHDFPDVTLVGILNVDQGLFSTDFRATERLAQLVTQVAGRAGRSDKPGKVLLQTYQPEHPLLRSLLAEGYDEFSRQALKIRQECNLPPYTAMLMIRARANNLTHTHNFLQDIRNNIATKNSTDINLYGPIPAMMERKAGMYQCQLIVMAKNRTFLQQRVRNWTEKISTLPSAKRVRWDIEIDPLEMN